MSFLWSLAREEGSVMGHSPLGHTDRAQEMLLLSRGLLRNQPPHIHTGPGREKKLLLSGRNRVNGLPLARLLHFVL